MDPFNVAGAIFAASKVAWDVTLFWKDSASAPTEARELLETVELLQRSVQNVRDSFVARLNPDDIEQQNYKSIVDLVNKCERDLYRLRVILPRPPEGDAGRFQSLRTHFARRLCEDNVRDIVSGIRLCNNALQVELQTLTIFRMEQAQQYDHTAIKGAWDRVLGQADDLLSNRPFRVGDPDWDNCLNNFVGSLRDSASASEGRSTIAHSAQPPRRGSHQSGLTLTGTIYREDADSGVAIVDELDEVKEDSAAIPLVLGPSVLPRTLRKIDRCCREGKYREGAELQKRAISYRQMFAGDTPVPTDVLCRDEMALAEMYRRMGSPQCLARAEATLLSVIDRLRTDDLEEPGLKESLLAELYHDLGRVCVDLKKPGTGSGYLTDAFNLMVISSSSAQMSLLRSVGTMLYRIYTNMKQPEVAEALDDHAQERCGFSLKTLAWCQEQGFDTEHETFQFDGCDTRADSLVKGMSPLHVAAKKGQDDILRHMLSLRLNLEVTEHENQSTPFLLACCQQDTVVVNLLLQHGARPFAVDKLHRNGLHLCQRGTGGTGVARRLLEHPLFTDTNAIDSYQTTPLHLAAEAGNFKMVQLLLAFRADPNVRGPGGFTPLMGAVQATMKSPEAKLEVLKVLVDNGADASLEYSGGQTAADMANDGQVRKALRGWARKQSLKPTRRFTLSRKG